MGGGERFSLVEPRHALPVLEHLVEAEAGGTQRRSRFFIER
jgi:hypothetical protein